MDHPTDDSDHRADRKVYTPPEMRPAIGRPFKPISYALVEGLAGIGCTDEEIAAMCKVSAETFRRRKHDEPDLCGALEKGRAEVRRSLRRQQLDIAMGQVVLNPETKSIVNPTTMCIWLGKQLLGQRDQPEPERSDTRDRDPVYRISIGEGDALLVPAGTDPIEAYHRHVRSQGSKEPE